MLFDLGVKRGAAIATGAGVLRLQGAGAVETGQGGFGLEIALAVSLPGVDRAEAETLVAKAHEVCPYSNATRNNVDVQLSVV